MAKARMYFPFFPFKVKCGAEALEIADRQKAHGMIVALKGVIELFKAVKCEEIFTAKFLPFRSYTITGR